MPTVTILWKTRHSLNEGKSMERTERLTDSQKTMLVQGALSGAFFAIGTGNFLAGYLTYLGASPAFCAIVAAVPQLGCILQLLSPLFFERLRHRKMAIRICCFAFRMGMGLAGLLPFLLVGKAARLGAAFGLYLMAFLMAGFVTPGLDQWTMQLAPQHRRGRFFAWKNILSALLNAAISLGLGWQLDRFSEAGRAGTGYFVLYGTCCVLACADQYLLGRMEEVPCIPMESLRLDDLKRPLKDLTYRKIVAFLPAWFFAQNFSSAFLSVYMLQALGMSHTQISGVAMVASAAGIAGTWFWGRVADRSSWNRIMLWSGGIIGTTYLCWGAVPPGAGLAIPFLLQALVSACSGSFSMASANLQYSCAPREGKTIYLGVGAAISNLTGYGAALLGAWLQSLLELQLGIQSIRILFLCSGVFCLGAVLGIVPKLPKIILGEGK